MTKPTSSVPPAEPQILTTTSPQIASLERDLASVGDRRKWLRRIVIFLTLALIVGGVVIWRIRHRSPSAPRFITQSVTEGNVSETVQSTGSVKPLTEVQVGAQVSGRVQRVFVDFNSNVKKGDVLAELDPITYGAQVAQQRAQLLAQEAALARTEVNAQTFSVVLERAKKLRNESLGSQAELDTAQGQYDVAQAEIQQAKAQMAATRALIASASANLSFTRIYAPIDGVITNRAIDPGQTVAASFQAPILFVIAEDLRKMRIFADIDEADVGKLKEGMNAEATVDAFPGERFRGSVSQLRFSPNTVQGVVTYVAVVEVDNQDRKLRPGMTATVSVRTQEANGVFRLPNAALRFKPSPEKGSDGKPLPKPPERSAEPHTGRVYLLTQTQPGTETIQPRSVHIGITDGIYTELSNQELPVGTKVVTDEADEKDSGKKAPRLF